MFANLDRVWEIADAERRGAIVLAVNGQLVYHRKDYIFELQGALQEMIELFETMTGPPPLGYGLLVGRDCNRRVQHLKELVRCRVVGCGNGGACHGEGSAQFPCPLKGIPA